MTKKSSMNDRMAEIKFGHNCITFGEFTKGMREPIKTGTWDEAKGFINGYFGIKAGLYPVLEPGLHLKKTLSELKALGTAHDVGYVHETYKGALLPRLAHCKEIGWVRLDFSGGMFVSRGVQHPTSYTKGEEDWVRWQRQAHYKHQGIETLMFSGRTIVCLYNEEHTWEKEHVERAQGWNTLEGEALREALAKNMTIAVAHGWEQKAEAIFASADTTALLETEIRLLDGAMVKAATLVGVAKLYEWVGNELQILVATKIKPDEDVMAKVVEKYRFARGSGGNYAVSLS